MYAPPTQFQCFLHIKKCTWKLASSIFARERPTVSKLGLQDGSVVRLHGTAVDVCVCVNRKLTCMLLLPNFNVFYT